MEEIKYECEIITPMFINGVNPQVPELREDSINGMMHYWFRAINGHLPINELHTKEGELFGTNERSGKLGYLIENGRIFNSQPTNPTSPVPHKNFKLPAFNPILNTQLSDFSLSIFIKKNTNHYSTKVSSLFQLISLLGGLGKRTRRGMGVFKINKINNTNTLNFNNPEELLNHVLTLLNNVVEERFQINGNKIERINPAINSFPWLKSIELGKSDANVEDILYKISNTTNKMHIKYGISYQNAMGFANGNSRYSSPIYVSIVKVGNLYYPIISKLWTKNADSNPQINITQNDFISALS